MKSRRRRALISLVFILLLLLNVAASNTLFKTDNGNVNAGWYAWQCACDNHGYFASISGFIAAAGVASILGGPAGFLVAV